MLPSIFVLLILFSGATEQAHGKTTNTTAKPASPQTYLTEFLANSVTPPVRDNYALYSRLKSHNPADANSPHTTQLSGYKLSDKAQFSVFDLRSNQYYTITATCVAVTPHVYMFLDDNYRENVETLVAVAQDFEQKIYPTDHKYFGPEWTPGVDDDPHLVILNTPLQLASGYFSASDEFLRLVNPNSNEREMFYISVTPTTAANGFYLPTLAHEFQHMIEFHTRYNQWSWLNEASSVLAQRLNGYTSGGVENGFFNDPDTQLGGWTCPSCGTQRYYGVGYTFVSYLNDRFGSNVIGSLTQGGPTVTGFNAVNFALAQNQHPELDVTKLLPDWLTTNILNRQTADPHFNYQVIAGHSQPQSSASQLPATFPENTPQYAANYFVVNSDSGKFTLNFQGNTDVQLTGTQPHSGQMVWWSNRGDNSDSTLTHDFDLTSVKTATLKFWTWFDTEPNYDGLYIEASSDGGATWDILSGKYTVNTSRTGQLYGAALTGRSNPTKTNITDGDQNTAQWVQEQVDLSPYSGKRIKIRFEYVTDDAYNKQGVLLDDFEIPEINFKDDVETSENGWQAAGFVRVNNLVPQHFAIRVISQDGVCGAVSTKDLQAAHCIQNLTLSNTNTVTQSFSYQHALIIVAPYAIKTLMPSDYKLSLD